MTSAINDTTTLYAHIKTPAELRIASVVFVHPQPTKPSITMFKFVSIILYNNN